LIKKLVENNKISEAGRMLFMFTVDETLVGDDFEVDDNDEVEEIVSVFEEVESHMLAQFPSRSMNMSPEHRTQGLDKIVSFATIKRARQVAKHTEDLANLEESTSMLKAQIEAMSCQHGERSSDVDTGSDSNTRKLTLKQLRSLTQTSYDESAAGMLKVGKSSRGDLK
jgi:hypothetical protein